MRRATVFAAVLAAVMTLAGCGSDEPASGQGSGQPQRVEITFEGDHVTPEAKRIQIDAGETLELVVKADRAGELHVHSTPEKELPYGAGTTTLDLTIDQPGVVDVESHDLEMVVLQLEVR